MARLESAAGKHEISLQDAFADAFLIWTCGRFEFGHFSMQPDDHVCLCFRVSLRKLVNYMNREKPAVPSQLSECLGAGTGCQWCVPFLKKIHRQWQAGEEPNLPVAPEEYATRRKAYHARGSRDAAAEEGK